MPQRVFLLFNRYRNLWLLFLVGLGTLCLDQMSKLVVLNRLAYNPSLVVINEGHSFSLKFFFITPLMLSFVLIIVAGWLLRPWWMSHPFIAGLFFGGAVSNMLDRVIRGGVVDWLMIPFSRLRNNLADWAITLATASILIILFIKKTNHDNDQD